MPESINLATYKIEPQIIHLLPERITRKHKLVPVKLEGKKLTIAMANPDDVEAIDEIKLLTGNEIIPLQAKEKEVMRLITEHFGAEQIVKQSLIDMRLEALKAAKQKPQQVQMAVEEELPIARLVTSIIHGAVDIGASDIHFEPFQPEMRIRYRVDGILHDIMTIPPHVESGIVSRSKLLSNMDITEKRRPQDGHINISYDGKSYDMRVSTIPTVSGEKIVMRVLDKSSMLIGLEKLGLSKDHESLFKGLVKKPYGMIFVTGPTGSGKTTSLYSVLNTINNPTKNIITVEDPVEFNLNGVNQIQVNPDIDLSFATGLRNILRQDPDIIMVGEVRDKETAEIAIQAALTGHLVFSTLHTNDAPSAVVRMLDMGIEPFLIASTVIGVIAQRLARKICPECGGSKCSFCHDTGMKGRIGIFEIMNVSEEIQSLIIQRKSSSEIKQLAIKQGMITLQESGNKKVEEGVCTKEEVARVVYT